ncbi:MAG TPA: hypothetical protein VLG11_05355 [Candidatus Saccharimonadales bacterium]|nr:hypothetical protein [Candidatus Saccharimonadales bacterium]
MRRIPYQLGWFAIKKVRQTEKKQAAKKKISKVVSLAQEKIFSATTVFPFTLFPSTITINRTKISITNRVFFMVANVVSVNIEDILNVTSHVGPFFGSLEIHTKFFDPGKPYSVQYLWREDALKIDRIMHGYGIALEKNIDTDALSCEELASMLNTLGQEATET